MPTTKISLECNESAGLDGHTYDFFISIIIFLLTLIGLGLAWYGWNWWSSERFRWLTVVVLILILIFRSLDLYLLQKELSYMRFQPRKPVETITR